MARLKCFIGASMSKYFPLKARLNCFLGTGLAVFLEASAKWILVYYSGRKVQKVRYYTKFKTILLVIRY